MVETNHGQARGSNWLPWLTSALILAVCASVLLFQGVNEAHIRLLIRITARTSLTFLLCGLLAQSLATCGYSNWFIRQRSHWLVALLFSHAIHLAIVLWLWHFTDAIVFADPVKGIPALALNIVYFLVTLFAIARYQQSLNWLEKDTGHWMQNTLLFVIINSFAVAYGPRAMRDSSYWPEAAAILIVTPFWVWRELQRPEIN
jgi:hypothetical protein